MDGDGILTSQCEPVNQYRVIANPVMDSKSKWILWQESSHKLLGRLDCSSNERC
ncbi:hypothetical protein OsI_31620 [Oryza sativa Indica Group]|uniref:Uncharacterized protein n=1 Tax=Oryza sativa subsp. indica TaxID=39946 RepID=A2Z1Y8_ORYSI|nr:hypothetical protein OsI_31620 [Oryza sativa Indica Group]